MSVEAHLLGLWLILWGSGGQELVENALDAGSSTVSVSFKSDGLDALSVTDNGAGISLQDAPFLGIP